MKRRRETWIGPVTQPQEGGSVRVERRPALGRREETLRLWQALSGGDTAWGLGQRHEVGRLPCLLALERDEPRAMLPLGLDHESLVLLGFGFEPRLAERSLGEPLVAEALRVAREIGRQEIVAPITNADVLAFFFLQVAGFRLAETLPYAGPEHTGPGGVAAEQELVMRLPV